MKPRMYGGMKANQKPIVHSQKERTPQVRSSLKPNIFGNQKFRPANRPNSTPPMITLWKWAIRNSELCSTKSAGGTASITPVMPPMMKVIMKAMVHIIGSS